MTFGPAQRRWLKVAGWMVGSILGGLAVDKPVYRYYTELKRTDPDRVKGIERTFQVMRVTGVEQFALLAGLVLWRCHQRGWRAMLMLWLAGLLAAGSGALLSRCIGRLRPEIADGQYKFVLPPKSFHWKQEHTFACPSGHATGSFTAMLMLRHFAPRGGPIFLIVGGGCGLERIATRAHFVSDVVVGFWVAWLVTRLTIRLDRRWWPYANDPPRLGPRPAE